MNYFLTSILEPTLYTIKTYKRNDIIFQEKDNCTEVGFVLEGLISIKTILNNNDFEINLISQNQSYGTFLVFSNQNIYLGTAVAMKNTKILVINKTNLYKALTNEVFRVFFLEHISSTALKIQHKVKILSQGSIRDKILYILYDNVKRNNTNVLRLKSKQLMANFLCIPRPSLSRELIKLKNEGIIEYNKNSITILK